MGVHPPPGIGRPDGAASAITTRVGSVAAFELSTWIASPVEVCFDLSRSIDLHLESMLTSRERAVGGITSGLIGEGEEVTWEARHFGVIWRMTSRITEFDPPHFFVDQMVRGPFRSFRHEHRFEREGAGTRMTDLVEYAAPLGALSNPWVGWYLRRLVGQRNATICRRAEGG